MPSEVNYISPEDLSQIVDVISSFDYVNNEEVPHYDDEQSGIDNYFSLIDRLRSDLYYPSLLDKATALFLYLNTGHYFSNGNKRLAVFSLLAFLESNRHFQIKASKDEFSVILMETLNSLHFEDFPEFSSGDFVMYNLALVSAKFNSEGVSFDDAKERVRKCISRVFQEV